MKLLYATTFLLGWLLSFSSIGHSSAIDASAKLVEDTIFGGSVYVRLAGEKNKPAVVLIHGLDDSASEHWDKTIELLKHDYRVLALDLPGFGRSDKGNRLYSPANYARLINRLVHTYLGKKFHLVGHSMGGAISLYYAARYTNDLHTLTLIDAAGILHRATYAKNLAVFGISKWLYDGSATQTNSLLDWAQKIVGSFEARLPIDPAWLLATQSRREQFLKGNPMAIAGLAMITQDFSRLVPEVKVPTLLIWGEHDQIAPLRTGYLLNSIIPVSTLHILPNIGHTPVIEDPDTVHRLLQAHLKASVNSEYWNRPTRKQLQFKSFDLCENSNNKRYSGYYEKLVLTNCQNVVIENAVIGELQIVDSKVEILNSTITAEHLGLTVSNSNVEITASSITADDGILVGNSHLDIAGTKFAVSIDAIIASSNAEVVLSLVYIRNPSRPDSRMHGTYILQAGESL